jgi:HSP20 family protein
MEDKTMHYTKWNKHPMFAHPFDAFLEREIFNNNPRNCNCNPATNIMENNDAYIVEMRVPGMSKEDFQIKLEKEKLTISTEKNQELNENVRYTRKEFSVQPFSRSFLIPETVDAENITGEYENGILKVTLPKKAESKNDLIRQISVN